MARPAVGECLVPEAVEVREALRVEQARARAVVAVRTELLGWRSAAGLVHVSGEAFDRRALAQSVWFPGEVMRPSTISRSQPASECPCV